jgi:glycolate oxidase FAD binding subunit
MTDIAAHSEADVVEAVRAAREWKSPLNIVGARTKRAFGRAAASWGTVLDLSGLSGVVVYEPEELILTVRPGTPIAEIEALLAAKNQHLGFDPADWGPLFGAPAGAGTIGGAIAADVAGSGAVRHGRVRDHLLGFHAVNGLGEAYKAGGRVVKNVTGFDLPKLMCGSFGTLGPLTEITLRVFPKPMLSATLAVRDVGAEDGLALLRRVWSSPLDATGLAYIPANAAFQEFDGISAALVRLDGAREPVREKIAALRAMVTRCSASSAMACRFSTTRSISGAWPCRPRTPRSVPRRSHRRSGMPIGPAGCCGSARIQKTPERPQGCVPPQRNGAATRP